MTILLSVFFGAVQGLTEFLPISSSGHLVILHEFFPDFLSADQLGFDVALHAGSLIALVLFFRQDVGRLLAVAARWLIRRNRTEDGESRRLALSLILAAIPAAVAGFLFESIIETTFRSIGSVAAMLAIGGVAFLLIEAWTKNDRSLAGLRLRDAFGIGLAQVLAFLPGISRSGSTIAAGRALGLDHESAARFSFLLSIPVIFGAALKKGIDLLSAGVPSELWLAMAVGFLAALLVGLAALRFLMAFFRSHTLKGFAYYRFGLAALLLLYLLRR